MTKVEMLNIINNLIVCLRGEPTDEAVHNLVTSQLERKEIDDLESFYWDIMCDFYGEHHKDFRNDYYWEFCVQD